MFSKPVLSFGSVLFLPFFLSRNPQLALAAWGNEAWGTMLWRLPVAVPTAARLRVDRAGTRVLRQRGVDAAQAPRSRGSAGALGAAVSSIVRRGPAPTRRLDWYRL